MRRLVCSLPRTRTYASIHLPPSHSDADTPMSDGGSDTGGEVGEGRRERTDGREKRE